MHLIVVGYVTPYPVVVCIQQLALQWGVEQLGDGFGGWVTRLSMLWWRLDHWHNNNCTLSLWGENKILHSVACLLNLLLLMATRYAHQVLSLIYGPYARAEKLFSAIKCYSQLFVPFGLHALECSIDHNREFGSWNQDNRSLKEFTQTPLHCVEPEDA